LKQYIQKNTTLRAEAKNEFKKNHFKLMNSSVFGKTMKNLKGKVKYVVHYENVKLYESLGSKITKIHKGVRFEESHWLKQYTEKNTTLRGEAKMNLRRTISSL